MRHYHLALSIGVVCCGVHPALPGVIPYFRPAAYGGSLGDQLCASLTTHLVLKPHHGHRYPGTPSLFINDE